MPKRTHLSPSGYMIVSNLTRAHFWAVNLSPLQYPKTLEDPQAESKLLPAPHANKTFASWKFTFAFGLSKFQQSSSNPLARIWQNSALAFVRTKGRVSFASYY
ncbi:hypothetical protein MPNT_120060 [Candidatus Methylacidithermus pantelleriae]|uniref:Uncharacterized protein n=1 Tax=Candidatus Methylacidithermus pantelleriae TaxID=2744239 RepID=A0A8J2BMJ4_9BACT|nr:hypothetical protein MPNT_120060 [Candidatus Methylacidithermus pantelleriae]